MISAALLASGSGGAAPSNETQILALPNQIFWFKGNAVTQSGTVSAMQDKFGLAADFVQATGGKRPVYTASGLNGLPGVTFDGSTYLSSGLSIPDGAKTLWLVRSIGETIVTQRAVCQIFNATGTKVTEFCFSPTGGATSLIFDEIAGGQTAVATSDALDTAGHADIWTWDGSLNQDPAHYTDSFDGVSNAVDSTQAMFSIGNTTTLGGSRSIDGGAIGLGFVGTVQEIGCLSGVISSPNLAILKAYTLAEYGV